MILIDENKLIKALAHNAARDELMDNVVFDMEDAYVIYEEDGMYIDEDEAKGYTIQAQEVFDRWSEYFKDMIFKYNETKDFNMDLYSTEP